MKQLKAFASALCLTLIITPTTALADSGYDDNGGDGGDALLFILALFALAIVVGSIVSMFGPKE